MPHQGGQLRYRALPAQQAHCSNICFLLTVSIIQENQKSCLSPQSVVSGLGKTAPASSSYLHLAHALPTHQGRGTCCKLRSKQGTHTTPPASFTAWDGFVPGFVLLMALPKLIK